MKNPFGLAIVLSALFGASCDGEQSRIYNTLDSNDDGYVSQEEGAALEGLTETWEIIDVNQDGQLDAAEFAKFEIRPIAPKSKQHY